MSYTELVLFQFHQTRRIHHKQSGKLVKCVAHITFSLTSPELSPQLGNKVKSLTDTCVCQVYTVQRETFEGENFHEFRSFVAIRKSFLHKIRGMASLAVTPVSNQQVFSARILFPPNCEFSPSKVSCYMVQSPTYTETHKGVVLCELRWE